VKYYVGILEDVLIKVGDLYIQVDLEILEIKEDTRSVIILRGPFLDIIACCIDVKNGKLSFDVGGDQICLKRRIPFYS